MGDMQLDSSNPIDVIDRHTNTQQGKLDSSKKGGSLSAEAQKTGNRVIEALDTLRKKLLDQEETLDTDAATRMIKADFDRQVTRLTREADKAGKKLSNLFLFGEKVFGEGQEMLVLVTELTMNYHSARFISRFGSKEYFRHNKELLFYERQKELSLEIERLEIEYQS